MIWTIIVILLVLSLLKFGDNLERGNGGGELVLTGFDAGSGSG
jgi:hypothetical protein